MMDQPSHRRAGRMVARDEQSEHFRRKRFIVETSGLEAFDHVGLMFARSHAPKNGLDRLARGIQLLRFLPHLAGPTWNEWQAEHLGGNSRFNYADRFHQQSSVGG
jgi:hypothetical protein